MSTEITSKSDESMVALDFTSTEKVSECEIANAPEIVNVAADRSAPVDSNEADILWKVVILFAVSNAIIISNLYLTQPLLEVLKDAFGVYTAEIGTIPTFIQIGYVLGLAFSLPLGDLLPLRQW
ncbi:hypothetical protein M427DRAFT_202606 [Gonapodya prolifera JEL478]|uniref:Uncharacterized protein n=1 Tax=Gonapodya prolifera (strain JEL478) TaxID=1344416 RepID=A0A138ZZH5_GONPJ|nr:hypothetical protein M427DRAFT_202606 [Gonapodya prolifera JEL478]|eukprot:KXS09904.1 hypothetical protein M427DRAFT_202606 [Gonapodya prolifera JEL478]